MRLIAYLFLIALIAFGAWPYYQVFRLDEALGKNDMTTLAELIDVEAVRRSYQDRIEGGLGLSQPQDPASALGWLQQNLHRLGEAAIAETITLEWVRDSLREAAARATDKQPPYFMAGIDFAFFESTDRFLIRLGELGEGETHVRLTRDGLRWRVTDVIR